MLLERRTEKHKPITLAVTAVLYILWLWVYLWCEARWSVTQAEITAVSVLGTAITGVYAAIWWRLTGRLFTPYHIFLAFFTAFNFGQCLLWAVGIHTDREIGQQLVYSTLAAEPPLILRAQLIFIICLITCNCGAMLVWTCGKSVPIQPLCREETGQNPRYRYLFYTALLLSLVVIPVTLYHAVQKLVLTLRYGYSSLYYGEAAEMVSDPVINILVTLFFPCLLGLLIGSRYDKRVRGAVYAVFAAFAAVTLLSGDRGEWFNLLVFLLWAEFSCYRKRSPKAMAAVAAVGLVLLPVIHAIVSLRNTGLSWEGFVSTLAAEGSHPIIALLTEFGHSMGISILLLALAVEFPYGNTYLMSIPTVFGTGLGNQLLGTDYVQLHTWFPQFLGIRYGTDFSIIGEAMLNFGVYLTPLVLLLEGMAIGAVAQIPYRRDRGPLALCLSLSAMVCIVGIARSTVWLVLNRLIFTLILFPAVYCLVKALLERKEKM